MKNYAYANHAFGLPSGSIRALLALIIFSAIWVLLARHPDLPVPSYLRDLMFIIMGHYFAARGSASNIEDISGVAAAQAPHYEHSPLYLPKGTIRWLLVLGFLSVAGILTYQHCWIVDGSLSESGITLILIAGFLLGVLRAKLFLRERRWLEDLRASAALMAALSLLLMVFDFIRIPQVTGLNQFQSLAVKFRYEEVLAAIIGFYFGSKSR